jgi:cobalt/nickel transport system permease protein
VRRGPAARGAVERTVDGLLHVMDRAVEAEAGAARPGLLQAVDPRVKLAGLFALMAAVALSHRLEVNVALLLVGLALVALSQVRLLALVSGAWLVAVSLSLTLALPALFLTPGPGLARLPLVGWEVTSTGLTSAAYLVLRVAATATFGFLLVFTTPWPRVLTALRALGVPAVAVAVLGMTYRYILLLLEAAHDMFVARRSRAVGRPTAGERRRLAGQHAGVLLSRSLHLGGEVYLAMRSRGYRGDVRLLDECAMARADWFALAAFAAVSAAAIWAGR